MPSHHAQLQRPPGTIADSLSHIRTPQPKIRHERLERPERPLQSRPMGDSSFDRLIAAASIRQAEGRGSAERPEVEEEEEYIPDDIDRENA